MFGIGMPELILILAVALIVIGPKKLPDLAKSLGKAMGEFKKATNDIKDSMQLDSGIQEVKTSFKDLEEELKAPMETSASEPSEMAASKSEAPEMAEEDADDEMGADTLPEEATEADAPGTEAPESEASDADEAPGTDSADTDDTRP